MQQSSCLCSSSTPCVTKQRILATSVTTALCCQRLAQFFEWSWYSWLGQMHLKFGNTIVLIDCFPSLCLGPCCTCPLCCLGRGRFREGVWSTQSAQDWLWPGGPPHTSESRGEPFWCTMLLWRTEYDVQVTLCQVKPFSTLTCSSETGFCWCGYRISGTGSWGCLWDGLHWQKLWQVQVSMSQKKNEFINRLKDLH